MSTNFYWIIDEMNCTVVLANYTVIRLYLDQEDPRIHIGLRTFNTFIWAQDPHEVKNEYSLKELLKVIVDENGQEYTMNEFWDAIRGKEFDLTQIGTRFA